MAKRHHYVPAFLLANWSDSGDRSGRLWSFPSHSETAIQTSVNNAAVETHFYRTQSDEQPNDVIERLYSHIEAEASPAIQAIIDVSSFPDGEQRASLLYFVAHQLTRVHGARTLANEIGLTLTDSMIQHYLRNPEAWIEVSEAAAKAGHQMMAHEDFKAAFDSGLELQMNPDFVIGMNLQTARDIYPDLWKRQWAVVETDGEFIISDDPVVRFHLEESCAYVGQELGLQAGLFLPISPRKALISAANHNEGQRYPVDGKRLSLFNTASMKNALRAVYGSSNDFVWWAEHIDREGSWADLVEWRSRRVAR